MSYTEDALVEQPAINLFSDIGWQTLDCYSETFDEEGLLGGGSSSSVSFGGRIPIC
jgi:type I restriction enzyme, R subunit